MFCLFWVHFAEATAAGTSSSTNQFSGGAYLTSSNESQLPTAPRLGSQALAPNVQRLRWHKRAPQALVTLVDSLVEAPEAQASQSVEEHFMPRYAFPTHTDIWHEAKSSPIIVGDLTSCSGCSFSLGEGSTSCACTCQELSQVVYLRSPRVITPLLQCWCLLLACRIHFKALKRGHCKKDKHQTMSKTKRQQNGRSQGQKSYLDYLDVDVLHFRFTTNKTTLVGRDKLLRPSTLLICASVEVPGSLCCTSFQAVNGCQVLIPLGTEQLKTLQYCI